MTMPEDRSKTEKRMIGDTDYEVIHSIPVGGKEILLAENMAAEGGLHYLLCDYQRFGMLGEYSHVRKSDEYLELLKIFSHRIGYAAEDLYAEQVDRGLPIEPFTAEHCYPHDYGENIVGKVVAIKPEVVNPEYRGFAQLVLVTGGFGAQGNARGQAVFCVELDTGKRSRFERSDVLGVVKELPDWAKTRLAKIQAEREPPAETEHAGETEPADIPKSEQPIYKLPFDVVRENGEWDAYHRSRQLNIECGQAIDQAISDSNYEPFHYDLKTAVRTAIAEFGAERVAWVLASNVKYAQWDGRLSSATKAWAEEFDRAQEFSLPDKPDVYLQSHKVLIDGFVDRFREVEREKPSLMETLKAGAKKSAEQFGDTPAPGKDAPKKDAGREVR